jgi:hypothetical protein
MLEGKKVACIQSMGIMFSIQSGTEKKKVDTREANASLSVWKESESVDSPMNGNESADPERWLGGEFV